jgi:peptidoglycan hydrolase-like protein with peptidoglycan-binding domain
VAPTDEATAPLDTLEVLPATASGAVTAGQTNDSPPPQTKKHRTRFAALTRSSHRQWGPPLLLQEPLQDTGADTRQFDPVVKTQQENLLALGFAVGKADGFTGPRTERALEEFKALYLSSADLKRPLSDAALIAITRNYADLARGDASHFKVDQGVLAAIRLSSVRTGIDFAYLMKLAAVESNFNPTSKAAGSSATGLYQFTRDTWLNTVKAYGDNYGLGVYTEQIDYIIDRDGNRRPVVRDKAVYRHLLDLRTNPRVSAMMAAELVKNNLQRLVRSFDRTPSQADLYLTHFLGTDGAISFLKALDETPDALAVDMFPAAAQSNQDIFHPKTCRPRTVDEVYALFGQKFNTSRYDLATN